MTTPEHVETVREVSYMTDQAFCSCGWQSRTYWDGAEYAHDEWTRHVAEATKLPSAVKSGRELLTF